MIATKQRRKKISKGLSELDASYQEVVKKTLDPILLGKQHTKQLLTLSKGLSRDQSLQERQINRRLLAGVAGIFIISLTYLATLPLLPLVMVLGIYNLLPLFKEGWYIAYKERRFSLLHLLAIYFSSMWLFGSYLVGAIGVTILNLNRKVLFLSQSVTKADLTNLIGEKPEKVWILVDDAEIEIPFEELKIGDILLLRAGQAIPIDGVIIKGSASIDQHRLTGEAQPAEKIVKDTVFASTLILNGSIYVQVEKAGKETAAAKIGSILNETVKYQQSRISDQFQSLESTRWPMLVGGGIGLVLGGPATAAAMLGCNFTTSMVPLRLVTLLNGLRSGADTGVLIKDGRVLDQIALVDTVVFDKTGTLTTDFPKVRAIYPAEEYSESEILALVASAEQFQSHPIAQAILAEARKHHLTLMEVEEADYQLGLGLVVEIGGQTIQIGSEGFLKSENIFIPKEFQDLKITVHSIGNTLIFIVIDNNLAGAIELSSILRPGAEEVIHWLKKSGANVYILSGDQEAPTQYLAAGLGADGYFANTLPEQKAEKIKKLQQQGRKVCFIGDGINDAIALHQADVSVSLGCATTIATDSAQIVLMDSQLKQLMTLWELSENFTNTLQVNYRLAKQFSIVSAISVIFLPFKFWLVEILWSGQAITGMKIASRSLLRNKRRRDGGS